MRLNVYLEKNISIFEFSIAIPKPISTIVSFSLEYVYMRRWYELLSPHETFIKMFSSTFSHRTQ